MIRWKTVRGTSNKFFVQNWSKTRELLFFSAKLRTKCFLSSKKQFGKRQPKIFKHCSSKMIKLSFFSQKNSSIFFFSAGKKQFKQFGEYKPNFSNEVGTKLLSCNSSRKTVCRKCSSYHTENSSNIFENINQIFWTNFELKDSVVYILRTKIVQSEILLGE